MMAASIGGVSISHLLIDVDIMIDKDTDEQPDVIHHNIITIGTTEHLARIPSMKDTTI